MKLLSIDPSLTSSGWSLFDLSTGSLIAYGILSPPKPPLPLSQRLKIFQNDVGELFQTLKLSNKDFLVCEGPGQLVLNPMSSLKVERVRSIFESMARSLGVMVPGRINPRSVQSEVLGLKGRQADRKTVKEITRATVNTLFNKELSRHKKVKQDIIDAIALGVYVMPRIQNAIQICKSGSRYDFENLIIDSIQPKASQSKRWSGSAVKARLSQ